MVLLGQYQCNPEPSTGKQSKLYAVELCLQRVNEGGEQRDRNGGCSVMVGFC